MSFAEEGKVYTDTDLKKYGGGSSNTKKLDSENPCDVYKKLGYDMCRETDHACKHEWALKEYECLIELLNPSSPPVRVRIVK